MTAEAALELLNREARAPGGSGRRYTLDDAARLLDLGRTLLHAARPAGGRPPWPDALGVGDADAPEAAPRRAHDRHPRHRPPDRP